MTLVSLTDCCHLLAIDPKTLRRWLSLSHIAAQPHPLDARLKCVTREQVQQVAAAHRRTLADQAGLSFQPAPSALTAPSVMSVPVVSCAMPDGSAPLTDLTQQLVGLQAHVATLEHQLSLLLEQVQKEQEWPTSHASTVQDKSQESSQDKSQESSQEKSQESSQEKSQESSQEKSLDKGSALTRTQAPSIDRRKHPHVLPVVEYSAQGKYVLISPQEGMLSFEPDSPEWFAWLATLPSFRFVGKLGRFTAFRGYQCSASTPWWAHRQIRTHSHKRRLGMTASVTIECLELAASSLQALV